MSTASPRVGMADTVQGFRKRQGVHEPEDTFEPVTRRCRSKHSAPTPTFTCGVSETRPRNFPH